MTVVELLETAIKKNDVSYVKQAMGLLVPQNTEQLETIESKEHIALNNNEQDDAQHIIKQTGNVFTSIKKTGTSLKDTPKENKWKDDKSLFADEIGIGVQSPRKRDRKPSLVDVECSICNKHQKINKILATNYSSDPEQNTYVCDDCLRAKIRK